MGLHREVIRKDIDIACTKTALLGFLKERDANTMRDIMKAQQEKKKLMNRHLVNGSNGTFIEFTSYENKSAFGNIELDSVPKMFLIYTCIMQYLDMYIVDGFTKTGPNWNLYCYELRSDDLPNRVALSNIYNQME